MNYQKNKNVNRTAVENDIKKSNAKTIVQDNKKYTIYHIESGKRSRFKSRRFLFYKQQYSTSSLK